MSLRPERHTFVMQQQQQLLPCLPSRATTDSSHHSDSAIHAPWEPVRLCCPAARIEFSLVVASNQYL